MRERDGVPANTAPSRSRHQASRVKCFGVIAALGVAASLGCTTRTKIRPDYLPAVTVSAHRDPSAPIEVLGIDGHPVELKGRFDGVVVQRTALAGGDTDHFEAPVRARLDGPWLTVWDKQVVRIYVPPQVATVEVRNYDTSGAVAGGAVLTSLAIALTIGAASFIGVMASEGHGYEAVGLIFGVPMISIAIGLGAGGIPLIVAGTRKHETFEMRQSRSTPAPTLGLSPGSLHVSF